MDEFNIKVKELIDSLNRFEAETNIKKKQRYFYDALFMEKIESFKNDLNLDAIQSAVREYHFVDANKLVYSIIPSFADENAKSIANLLQFILTYTFFESDTKSEYIANAITFTNEYYIRLKHTLPKQKISEYINNSIEKNKADFMYEILQELNLKIPYDDIQYTIEETDENFKGKDIKNLNNIILYHIKSSKITDISSLMYQLGFNITFDPDIEKFKAIIDENEKEK